MSHSESYENIGVVPTLIMAVAGLTLGILPMLAQVALLLNQ